MSKLARSMVNVRLSPMRKLVTEARRNGMLGAEEAANLVDVQNISQQGTRLGNWLTRDQAKVLLAVPVWVKQGMNAWMTAARIEEGRLFRSIRKGGKKTGESFGDGPCGRSSSSRRNKLASSTSARTTCAAPAQDYAARTAATWSRLNSCSATPRSKPPSAISVPSSRSKSLSMTTAASDSGRGLMKDITLRVWRES
jgi:hypothetical protein